jgi:very-short-patch-repair endonuclease
MRYRSRRPANITRARQMRRKMGETEKRLWQRLRRKQTGFHFRRQVAVGRYFLDFYCAKARLCVEVDGDLHAQRQKRDRQRDAYLQQLGILTVRIPSSDICRQLEQVVEYIAQLCRMRVMQAREPPPAGSPCEQGEPNLNEDSQT